MPKNILVPTDLTVASLNTLKLALDRLENDEKINVVLLYAQFLEDSISDLLFYSPNKILEGLISPEFKEAIEIIRNRFEGKLSTVCVKLFHSNNKNYLHNFLIGNKIEEIYIPHNHPFTITKKSFNPIPLLVKANLPVYTMDWNTFKSKRPIHEKEKAMALFN